MVSDSMVILSAFLGMSPVVPLTESASGIKEGGKTGLTSVTVGILFLISLLVTPLLSYIPPQAISPVLILTGVSMVENIRNLPFEDFREWFPAFLVIVKMPLQFFSFYNIFCHGSILYSSSFI